MVGDQEYLELVARLDVLIDHTGEDETHPVVSQIDEPSALIEDYEDVHVPELAVR